MTRSYGDGRWDWVRIADNLDTPEKVDAFLAELRTDILRNRRLPTYGESDEHRKSYGYRIRDGRKYDEALA